MASASPASYSSPPENQAQTAPPTQEPDPNPSTESQPGPGSEQGEGDEEEAECGFCLFMKGGGCKDAFIAWEQCVEAAEKSEENIVEKCFEVTAQLKKCMDAHASYYEPILRAEEALADSIAEEMKEKEVVKEEAKEEKGSTESSE